MANALADAIGRLADATDASREVAEATLGEIRRQRFEGEGGQRPDRPAQPRELARMNLVTFTKALPGFWQQFRQIPPEFWNEDLDDDSALTAIVACPCGEEPKVPYAGIAECVCERFYAWTGRNVHVANSPQTRS